MKKFARLLVVSLCLTGVVLAHHGTQGLYNAEQVTLSGTIVECMFGNPHVIMKLKVADAIWEVTMPSVGVFSRVGLTGESFKAGTKATVTGVVHKQKANDMYAGAQVTIGDVKVGQSDR